MQKVTKTVYDAVSGASPLKITTIVLIGGEPLSVPVVSVVYTSAVGGEEGWSIGNALPATVQVALSGRVPIMRGAPVAVSWYVDEYPDSVYPLFSGVCDTSETVAGVTTVTAYDPLYSIGGRSYAPSPALLGPCTAADVLEELAGLLGIQMDAGTVQRAAFVQLDTGVSNLGDVSIAQAAGSVAGIMGGNAYISRSGELIVKAWQDTEWTGVTMAGTGTPAQEPFRPTGLSLLRRVTETVIGEDGTETTVERMEDNRAGIPNVSFQNDLATSVLAADAWARVSTLPAFHAGGYLLAGGVLLEAGDVFTAVTEDGDWTVYAGQVTLNIDGGCNAQVECWGASEAVEVLSPSAKAAQGVAADLATFKREYVENLTAQRAYIQSLSADEAFVDRLFSNNINAQKINISSKQASEEGGIYTYSFYTGYKDDLPSIVLSTDWSSVGDAHSSIAVSPSIVTINSAEIMYKSPMALSGEHFISVSGGGMSIVGGNISVSGTIYEGGQKLEDKYLKLSGGTLTGRLYATSLEVSGNTICAGDVYMALTTTSAASNMYIASGNRVYRASSSSRRYKTDITDLSIEEIRGLYHLPVRLFRYLDNYISEDDERYGKRVPGFIAEELDEILSIAVDHVNGQAEMWNSNIMVPCLLRLVQDLNERVSDLKSELSGVKEEVFQLKQIILEKE